MKRRVKARRVPQNASQIMETNENDYDSANEDQDPLQEPHPEPGGDKFSEQYEEESSQYSNSRSNSRSHSRVQIVDDESSFDRAQAADMAYADYLQDSHG